MGPVTYSGDIISILVCVRTICFVKSCIIVLIPNIVTFSYTTAFWDWDDWELQLDWMSLHGINLSLALVGSEKITIEVFQELGFSDDEILRFLSSPAFQSWNRLGNLKGNWNHDLPQHWIEKQFCLNQKIVSRMVELGMTPVLPAFAGFLPEGISRLQPNAIVHPGSQWSGFHANHTQVTFLEGTDPLFAIIQQSFITKQRKAYNDSSHVYLLDQYNENRPSSDDAGHLRELSNKTLQSLKLADSDAIWVMPSWQFSDSDFWTGKLIESWFSGIEKSAEVIVLDMFSESKPLWQSTNSFYGKPWIWCQLHDFGGAMGLGGRIMNLTINATEAVSSSSSLVGFGLTMEGQEQENQIVYDLLLDQAWSISPIETANYFQNWVTSRYHGNFLVPQSIYEAWDILRTSVYNNTNPALTGLAKSILGLRPSISGLVNRSGRHSTTIHYDQYTLLHVWSLFFNASREAAVLWENPFYLHDLVDLTRQVIDNEFMICYTSLVNGYTSDSAIGIPLTSVAQQLLSLLDTLDMVLGTNEHFRLSTWLKKAEAWADGNLTEMEIYTNDAKNQVTLWGPNGEISDYASKDWSGLVSSYYRTRWDIFVRYLLSTPVESYNETRLKEEIVQFEQSWQVDKFREERPGEPIRNLKMILVEAQLEWPSLFRGW